jgi:hypothetical protein
MKVCFQYSNFLLAHAKPMIDFENIRFLFHLLKMKHYPKKHLRDNASWGIVETFHIIVMQATKCALKKRMFFFCVMKLF